MNALKQNVHAQHMLNEIYEEINSTDSNEKNLTIYANCGFRASTKHVELKHPNSFGKYLRVNDDHKKSLTKGWTTSRQPQSSSILVKQHFVKDRL